MAGAHKVRSQDPASRNAHLRQRSVEQERDQSPERFRDRIQSEDEIRGGSCPDEEPMAGSDGDARDVVGVRFRDSSCVCFYLAGDHHLDCGRWVVVSTSRGEEAAQIVIASRQLLLTQLDGDLTPIVRVMSDDDVATIEHQHKESERIVRHAGELSRAHDLRTTVVAAEFSLDGSQLKLSYTAPDRSRIAMLQRMLQDELDCQVEMQAHVPREEARLLGGPGMCGRTLCRPISLPVYSDEARGIAKNQDLSLRPTRLSGMSEPFAYGSSYENEQYRQAKAHMPRLGQRVITDEGEGTVVSLQILKDLVTIRYTDPNRDHIYPASGIATGAAFGDAESTDVSNE